MLNLLQNLLSPQSGQGLIENPSLINGEQLLTDQKTLTNEALFSMLLSGEMQAEVGRQEDVGQEIELLASYFGLSPEQLLAFIDQRRQMLAATLPTDGNILSDELALRTVQGELKGIGNAPTVETEQSLVNATIVKEPLIEGKALKEPLIDGRQNQSAEAERDTIELEQLMRADKNTDALLKDQIKDLFFGNKDLLTQMSSKELRQQIAQPNDNQIISTAPGLGRYEAVGNSAVLTRSIEIMMPVNQQQWTDKFNDQIIWLSNQQLKTASIKLNPPELGPIEVSINMSKDQANIHFNSHSMQIRDVIEQALPKLRDMMGEQGVSLGDVNVSDQSEQAQAKSEEHLFDDSRSENLAKESTNNNGVNVDSDMVAQRITQGLVDYFA